MGIPAMKAEIHSLNEKSAALKAENERLTRERDHHSDLREQYLAEAERTLAERAGGVKGEWHRADGDKSILLYTLRQDGWRKGEAVMVNDVTVRIEAANGSESPIEPIASAILSALTTEPAAPEGRQEAVVGRPSPDRFEAFESEIEPGVWYVGDERVAFLRVEVGVGNPKHIAESAAAGLNATYVTRPAEQAVTDVLLDLVTRAREIIPDHYENWHTLAQSAALKAAMEAGRHE